MKQINLLICIMCLSFLQQGCRNTVEKGTPENQDFTVNTDEEFPITEDSITVNNDSISRDIAMLLYNQKDSLENINSVQYSLPDGFAEESDYITEDNYSYSSGEDYYIGGETVYYDDDYYIEGGSYMYYDNYYSTYIDNSFIEYYYPDYSYSDNSIWIFRPDKPRRPHLPATRPKPKPRPDSPEGDNKPEPPTELPNKDRLNRPGGDRLSQRPDPESIIRRGNGDNGRGAGRENNFGDIDRREQERREGESRKRREEQDHQQRERQERERQEKERKEAEARQREEQQRNSGSRGSSR